LLKNTSICGSTNDLGVSVYVGSVVVALALAILLPRQAIEMVPPGTVSMLFPVDGLASGETDDAVWVGDGDSDTDADTESDVDGDGDVDGDPVVVGVGVGVGVTVGVGDPDGATAPPTATPLTQVKTYSIPGGLGRAMDGDGDDGFGGGGLVEGATGGEVEGVTLMIGVLEVVGVGDGVGVGVMDGGATGGVVVRAAELADAAEADCAATCLLTTSCGTISPWLPLTSRPTRSTAVNVTAVITTQESSQPSASVSGRPGRRRPPSARAPAALAAARRHHGPL
jgi:hypothetical protein